MRLVATAFDNMPLRFVAPWTNTRENVIGTCPRTANFKSNDNVAAFKQIAKFDLTHDPESFSCREEESKTLNITHVLFLRRFFIRRYEHRASIGNQRGEFHCRPSVCFFHRCQFEKALVHGPFIETE